MIDENKSLGFYKSIKDKINGLQIKYQLDNEILLALCLEFHGLPTVSAHTMLPQLVSIADENEYLKSITRLIAQQYIVQTTKNNIDYYIANYAQIGIENEKYDIEKYQLIHSMLDNFGMPHLPEATHSLHQVFIEEKNDLFIALGITGIEPFQDNIIERFSKGFRTIFIFPSKSSIKKELIEHYNQELRKWVKFINNLSKSQRNLIEFRIALRNYDELYTTLYSDGLSRINIRKNIYDSTRKGLIIQSIAGSSLHLIMQKAYQNIIKNSIRYFKINLIGFIKDIIGLNVFFLTLCAVLCIVLIFWPIINGSISSRDIIQFFISAIIGLGIDKFIRREKFN